jgi:predicted transcriptional regulator
VILEKHPALLELSASEMECLAEELQAQAKTKERERQKAWLNAEIQKGLDSIKAGRTIPGDEVKKRMDAHIADWKAKRSQS